MSLIMTGPLTWISSLAGNMSTAVMAKIQEAGKRQYIKSISLTVAQGATVTISEGTNATASKTLLQIYNATNSIFYTHKFINPVPLDVNKSLIIGSSNATGMSFIIEGETV